MNFSPLPNSGDSTACHPTKSGSGSRDSGFELNLDIHHNGPSKKSTCLNDQAPNLKPISTFGTLNERPPSSMGCAIHGPFTIQTNGNIGQTIFGSDGEPIAWTTDAWIAQVICKLLTDNQGLIYSTSQSSCEDELNLN